MAAKKSTPGEDSSLRCGHPSLFNGIRGTLTLGCSAMTCRYSEKRECRAVKSEIEHLEGRIREARECSVRLKKLREGIA